MRKKLLFGFFSENLSFPASILSSFAVEAGWEVDLVFFPNTDTRHDITRKIEQYKPDLVALTLKTLERNQAFRVAEVAHALGCKVVAGGSHPTVCPEDMAQRPFFDGFVTGDGSGIFQDILANYQNLSGERIEGKAHPHHSKYYANRLFSDTQIENIRSAKLHFILTSMGCPFSCSYCASQPYKPFNLRDVVNEIAHFVTHHGVERIVIHDDTFGLNLARIKKFRKLLKEMNVAPEFSLQMRTSCFSEAFAEEFSALGVTELGFGIETASEKLLKFINKQATVEDAYRSMEISKQYGLFPKINLLYGLPTQDREDYEDTFKFVRDVRPEAIFQYLFTPIPGSALYQYCIENGYMPDDLSFDNYLHIDPTKRDFKGYFGHAGILKKVDYAMASHYMNAIEQWNENRQNPVILAKAQEADEKEWILLGTGDYFQRVLGILSRHPWNHFSGYTDINPAAFKTRFFETNLKPYDWNSASRPPEIVLSIYKEDGKSKSIASSLLREKYNYTGEIRSVSTFGVC